MHAGGVRRTQGHDDALMRATKLNYLDSLQLIFYFDSMFLEF